MFRPKATAVAMLGAILMPSPASASDSAAKATLTEPASRPAHHYRIEVDPGLSHLDVHACFADSLPHHFVADDALARKSLIEASILLEGERVQVRPVRGALRFPIPSDDDCLDYRVNLETITAGQQLNHAYRLPNALLLRPQTWLWRAWSKGGRDIRFEFRLPKDMAVSVPWRPLDEGPVHRKFLMGESLFDWPALMAIGRLHTDEIYVPGATLHLAVLPGPGEPRPELARRWLKPAALAVSKLHGRFPRKNMQVLVIPLDGGKDAAPWAEVTRGGGPAAHFYMNAAADWPVFRDDWIATHELSHLALPFVSRQDKWLSEGIATYYQSILRARVGLISEREAWQAMANGFQRGRDGTDTTNLRNAALDMRSRNRFMRVYWTGAAIAMLGDIEVRRQTSGRWSLDRLLFEFQECCQVPGKVWRAREIFEYFDQATGKDVFIPLYEEHVYSRFFPRLEEAWQSLGIRIDAGDVVLETATAQQEKLRRSIMSSEIMPPESGAVSSE